MLLSLLLASFLSPATQIPPAARSQDPHAGHGHGAPASRRPQVEDKVRHLGPLKPGAVRKIEWDVKNEGSKPGRFRLVDSPPEVVAEGLDMAKPWAPGETRRITLTLSVQGIRGFKAWTLKLKADDPALAELTLPVDFMAVTFGVTPDKVTNLGSIGPKEVKTTTWELQNLAEGPTTFRLLDLAPGVRVDEGPLATPFAPGESRTISMSIDPTGFVGYQRRAARLESSDPDQPRYILRAEMTVRPEMAVDSLRRSLKAVKPFESPEVVFTFTREGGELAQIKLLTPLPPYLEAELVHQGIKAELHLTLRPRLLKPGVQAGLELFKVETNAPREPQFSLALDWRLHLPIVPEPSRVVFENLNRPSLPLGLKAANRKAFKILKAEIIGEGFAVGVFPKGTRPASRQIGTLPSKATKSYAIPVWVLAKEEAHAVLNLHCEGMDDPLQVPLAFLPPSAPAPAPKPMPKAE